MSNEKMRWDVFSIREFTVGNETKSAFTKVGAAFQNQNGSINVLLDAIPLDGKLQLQVPLTEEQRAELGLTPRGGQGGGQQRPQQQHGGYGPQGGQQHNQRNQGQQQRRQVQNRFGQRGPAQPQQQNFAPPAYTAQGGDNEQGWDVNGQWITDPSKLPPDHPDFIPF